MKIVHAICYCGYFVYRYGKTDEIESESRDLLEQPADANPHRVIRSTIQARGSRDSWISASKFVRHISLRSANFKEYRC